ncbi:MAG: hypothetical protein EB141_00190 [Verrucomicrobia bacterium]|nr:hypothetical protein [Pseudomonadota bacterium]NDA65119.1 hypothetical protein [Verrucomicrobiota bacterium]NDB74064.1 hypothetical protein [Verrucomicrobiota bacterium]
MGKPGRGQRKDKMAPAIPGSPMQPGKPSGGVSADVIAAANAKMALANQLRAQNAAMGKPPVMP